MELEKSIEQFKKVKQIADELYSDTAVIQRNEKIAKWCVTIDTATAFYIHECTRLHNSGWSLGRFLDLGVGLNVIEGLDHFSGGEADSYVGRLYRAKQNPIAKQMFEAMMEVDLFEMIDEEPDRITREMCIIECELAILKGCLYDGRKEHRRYKRKDGIQDKEVYQLFHLEKVQPIAS